MRKHKEPRLLKDLQAAIKDFGLMRPDIWQKTLGWYYIWKASNYVVLPYDGGLANQPAWVEHDFGIFDSLNEWIDFDRPTLEESRAVHGDVMDS